jgi:hypothetical protein
MPCGVECDQYQVVGEILELEEEINHYTKETVYIMVIECNNLSMTVAVNKADLLGEQVGPAQKAFVKTTESSASFFRFSVGISYP